MAEPAKSSSKPSDLQETVKYVADLVAVYIKQLVSRGTSEESAVFLAEALQEKLFSSLISGEQA